MVFPPEASIVSFVNEEHRIKKKKTVDERIYFSGSTAVHYKKDNWKNYGSHLVARHGSKPHTSRRRHQPGFSREESEAQRG